MAKEDEFGDQNFQQFLKLLNEIEKNEELDRSCDIEDNAELPAPSVSPNECSTGKHGSQRSPRRVLRRPGFVYRTKNSNESSVLDNNLWELRCSNRVLKSPAFKYRQKRASILSPYSLQVADVFSGLSIGQKLGEKSENEKIKISPKTNSACWHKNPNSENELNEVSQNFGSNKCPKKFIPLSTLGKITPRFGNTKLTAVRKKNVVKPSKLKMVKSKLPRINEIEPESTNNSWKIPVDASLHTFARLSESGGSWANTAVKNMVKFEPKNGQISTVFRESAQCTKRAQKPQNHFENSCSYQARLEQEISVDELSSYVEDFLVLPQKMSTMAEMMYT